MLRLIGILVIALQANALGQFLPAPSATVPTVVTAPVTVVAPEPGNEPVRVVQTEPITFKLPLSMLIGWMVTIATGLTAIAVIWRFGTKAAVLISDLHNYGGVLKEIAKEFKSDSGSTLKDAINRIEEATNVAQESATKAKQMAESLEKLLSDHIKSVEEEK